MNRQAQAVVMLLFGGAVLKASLGELYLRYVKESLQPFLIGAGVMLIAVAVMTLWYDLRHGSTPDTECADDHSVDGHGVDGRGVDGHGGDGRGVDGHGGDGRGVDGHGGDGRANSDEHTHGAAGHREPRIGWLLIAPVLGLLLVAPPALGAFAAGQSGSALGGQPTGDFPPLPDGDPAVISVLDYATRAVFDQGVSLGDHRVRLTGFVSKGADGQPILTRMVLSCCAADGRPIKVGMAGQVPAGVAEDGWIEVVGRYTEQSGTDPVNGVQIPYIEVLEWRQIEPPRNQYE